MGSQAALSTAGWQPAADWKSALFGSVHRESVLQPSGRRSSSRSRRAPIPARQSHPPALPVPLRPSGSRWPTSGTAWTWPRDRWPVSGQRRRT